MNIHRDTLSNLFQETCYGFLTNSRDSIIDYAIQSDHYFLLQNLASASVISALGPLQHLGFQENTLLKIADRIALRMAEQHASVAIREKGVGFSAQYLPQQFSPDYATLLSEFAQKSGYPKMADIISTSPKVPVNRQLQALI